MSTQDSTAVLPTEMLEHIFWFSFLPISQDRPYSYRTPSYNHPPACYRPIVFSQVNRRWRAIALNTSFLWTNLFLDMPDKAWSLFLERSGTSLLTIHCRIVEHNAPTISSRVSSLMELRPRIGELKLRDVPKCDLLRLFTAPAYKAKFPWHIQTLYIEHGSFERLNLPFNFFSGVSASLQTLTLIGVEIPAGMFLPFLANLSYHGYPVLPRATHDDECNGMDHMRLPPGEDLHLRHLSKLLPRKLSSLESSFHLPLLERLCIRTDSRECLQILSRLPIPLYTCVEIQSRGMLTLEDPPIANYFEAYLVNTSGSYLMSISTHHPQNHRDRSAVMQLHEVQDMYEADVEEVGGELNTSAPFLKMSLGTLSTTSKLERALARISPNSISGLELHASLLDKWDRDTVWKIFNKFQSVTYLHLLGEEAMYICAALIPREITPDGPTVAPGSAASTVLFPELTELHFTCVSFPPWEAGHTVEPYASLTGIFWSRWEKLGTILQRMILTSCTGWEEHVERWQEYAVDPIIAEPTQESSEPSPSASEGVWA